MLKLANISVNRKLALPLFAALTGTLILLFLSANALKNNLMTEREARLNAVLTLAMSRIQALAQSLPMEQAQQAAKEMLNDMRFDGDNYIFVMMNHDVLSSIPSEKSWLDSKWEIRARKILV